MNNIQLQHKSSSIHNSLKHKILLWWMLCAYIHATKRTFWKLLLLSKPRMSVQSDYLTSHGDFPITFTLQILGSPNIMVGVSVSFLCISLRGPWNRIFTALNHALRTCFNLLPTSPIFMAAMGFNYKFYVFMLIRMSIFTSKCVMPAQS